MSGAAALFPGRASTAAAAAPLVTLHPLAWPLLSEEEEDGLAVVVVTQEEVEPAAAVEEAKAAGGMIGAGPVGSGGGAEVGWLMRWGLNVELWGSWDVDPKLEIERLNLVSFHVQF